MAEKRESSQQQNGQQQQSDTSPSTPPTDLDWEQEKTKVRVRQFMNILEQLPRLCSPTICGTLSQPTTRTERATRGADIFEWSLEQKAILSPANITTDTEGTDEWPTNTTDLNPAWRQQESEMFFSQRIIAPSPMITPSTRALPRRPPQISYQDLMYDEGDEDAEEEEEEEDDVDEGEDHAVDIDDDDDNQQAQDLTTNKHMEHDQSSKMMSYEFEDNHCLPEDSDADFDLGEEEEEEGGEEDDTADNIELEDDDDEHEDRDDSMRQTEEDQIDDNLYFSPQPLKSSQTQQRMSIFSPDTFSRVMEDENTLQSTPKTTGSQRAKARTRNDVLD